MKIGGVEIKGPNEQYIVIPRPARLVPAKDGTGAPVIGTDDQPVMEEVSGDIVFKAQAVLDYKEFEQLCPQPKPPMTRKPGQSAIADPTDLKYRAAINRWAEQQTHYMILKSLSATENLEWASVEMGNPDTWKNYITDLKDAGFTTAEANRIMNGVAEVNGFDEDKFEQARQRFLASRVEQR